MKDFKYVVKVEDFATGACSSLHPQMERTVKVTSTEQDFWKWAEVVATPDSDAQPFTRDLILRPTDQEPGIYEDDGGPWMVARRGEQNYLLIWTDDAERDAEKGDWIAKGCYPAAVRTIVDEADSGIEINELQFNGEVLHVLES